MEEVERFTAKGDDGRLYTVILWAHLVPFTDIGGHVSWKPGGTEYLLLDGRDVTMKQPGVFQILDTEEIIRKIVD